MNTLSEFSFLVAQNASLATTYTYFKHGGAWVGLAIMDKARYPYADNLLSRLVSKKWISSNIFTIHSNSTWMRISMGGYSPSIIADITNNTQFSENLIKWQNLTEPVWSLKYSAIYLQDQMIESKPMVAYIDLNFTNIKVPIAHFKIIMDYIMKTKDCRKVNELTNSLFTCVCKNFYDCGFPKLKIYL